MLETLRNAFKIKDIRNRIIFTFLMLVVIRIGSQLPIPGVNNELFSNWFASQTADGMGFFDAITGGSFYNMSIFALNITPYITSSIIMQLLTIAIPKLEEMQRDGEEGRKKIAEITRYLTVALALIEAIAMAISFKRGQMLQSDGILTIIMVIFTLTAGSAVLMWIGERITEKGVGNGISIVLTINIISRVPNDMGTLYQQFITGKSIPKGILAAVIIIAIIVAMVVFVVFLQGGERRIPVQYLCTVSVADTGYHCKSSWKRKRNRYRKQDFKRNVSVKLVQSKRAGLFHRTGGIYRTHHCFRLLLYFNYIQSIRDC